MSDTCQPCSSGSSTHTHTHTPYGHTYARTQTPIWRPYISVRQVFFLRVNNTNKLVGLCVLTKQISPLHSDIVSSKNILSLIQTQLGVTQTALSSRKNLPSQMLLLEGFGRTHSSLERTCAHTHTNTFPALH